MPFLEKIEEGKKTEGAVSKLYRYIFPFVCPPIQRKFSSVELGFDVIPHEIPLHTEFSNSIPRSKNSIHTVAKIDKVKLLGFFFQLRAELPIDFENPRKEFRLLIEQSDLKAIDIIRRVFENISETFGFLRLLINWKNDAANIEDIVDVEESQQLPRI